MQELRLVAVSEDGTYLVLATAGRGTRFTLPVDDRLRAAVRGHFSRLGQFEIEVESPLRPKEIQARIRSGETAEEIAESAGIPVERVRWFEGPVLQEREYMAQQAQRVTVRRPGETAPGPPLGETVEERLGRGGVDLEEAEWDSWKCEDSTWRVRLSFFESGRPHAAEWTFDPRRRHVTPLDEIAARLTSVEWDDETLSDTVTPLVPRRPAMKVVSSDRDLTARGLPAEPEQPAAPGPLRAAEPPEYLLDHGRAADPGAAFREASESAPLREAAAPLERPRPSEAPRPVEAPGPAESSRPSAAAEPPEDFAEEPREASPGSAAPHLAETAEDTGDADAAATEAATPSQATEPAAPEEAPRADDGDHASMASEVPEEPAEEAPAAETRPVRETVAPSTEPDEEPAEASAAHESDEPDEAVHDEPAASGDAERPRAEDVIAEPAAVHEEPAAPAAEPEAPAESGGEPETAPAPDESRAEPREPGRDAPRPAESPQPAPQRRQSPRPPAKKKPAGRPTMPAAQDKPATGSPAAAAGGEPAAPQRPARRRKSKGKRASVPSWDEIMFGARRPE
ncbi:DUF3071 domain-containing protein [Actinomadura madurae]|uniref:septation protein SepH n=1 Tax=Actinomadura madurae TaxID=1993 RepID=UPI00399B1FBA